MTLPSAPIASLAALWDRSPSGALLGGRSAVSAAIWSFTPNETHDIRGDTDPETNIVSVPCQGRSSTTYFADGREAYSTGLQPFDFNIVRAGETPRALLHSEMPFRYLHIYLPQRLLLDLAEDEPAGAGQQVELIDPRASRDEAVTEMALGTITEVCSGSWLARMALDGFAIMLGVHLLRRHSNLAAKISGQVRPPTAERLDWRIRRTIEQLESRLHDDVGLAEIAAEVDLTPRHYARLFRAATGLSPHAWITKRRIDRACAMLIEARRPVTDIALELGFPSSQHFATVFRKHVGVTPSHYRRAHAT